MFKKFAYAILMLGALSSPSQSQTLDRAQEYRMWSAEQMINRLVQKMGRSQNVCNQARFKEWLPKHSEECQTAVLSAYPVLVTIREVAMTGDTVAWAKIIDLVHELEAGIEAPLNRLERK